MGKLKILGTHMITMCKSIVVLHIDESAGKICTGFQNVSVDGIADIKTTNIRYTKKGEAFVERFRTKYYLSDFTRTNFMLKRR